MEHAAVVKLAPYWDVVDEHEDESNSLLRIAFATRNVAIVQLLVLADWVEIISPPELPSEIVERARRAIRAYDNDLS